MNFFDELKRRNVIKATIAYIVVAWVLLQVFTSVLPNLGAPPWVLKTLMFLIVIGLPIWIIFSWVYEMTPEGLKKTLHVSKEQSITEATNKRLNIIIIITLIIAIAVSFLNRPIPDTASKTISNNDVILDNSIAVIPFKNWSGDPELEYISDGMTDAVITRLTMIKSMAKVIPLTSVIKYKTSDQSVPDIAEELGVQNILQGNFQLSGDQMKITLQLIDGPSNKHSWSQEYTGEWKNDEIFKIQSEVAENVAKNMNVEIKDEEFEALKKIPTQSKEAYNYWLQANFQARKRTKNGMSNAVPLYEKAIDLDSTFIGAYISLAYLYEWGGANWGIYSEQEAWGKAKGLLQKANQLDSTNTSINRALLDGSYLYEWNFERMEKEYKQSSVAIAYTIQTGRYEESLAQINQDIDNNPTSGLRNAMKANALFFLNRKEEAIDLLQRNDKLFIDHIDYLREAARCYYYMGKYKNSVVLLNRIKTKFPDRPPTILWLLAVHAQRQGDTSGLNNHLEGLQKKYEAKESGSPAWFLALYYTTIGEYDEAFEWLQKSYDRHEVEMIWLREEPALIPLRKDQRYLELYAKVGFPMEPHNTPE